jgi:hypothetical protein
MQSEWSAGATWAVTPDADLLRTHTEMAIRE